MNMIKERSHGTKRKTAIIVGALYIIGTVAGILSKVFIGFTKVTTNENQIIMAALSGLIMALALAMVPVMMFPILKKHNEPLALGYVIYRGALETVTTILMVAGWLFLAIVNQEYITGTLDASNFQTLRTLLLKGHDSINVISQIIFPLGALMFYALLFKSKLIPRWISGWGFIAAILWITNAFLGIFGLIIQWSPIQVILSMPIFFQEMVMAVWLIVKGFNPSAIAALSAKTNINEI